MLESVSKTGGHLSSNLGTVELTIALHYVFDTPTTASSGTSATRPTAQDPHRPARGMARLRMLDGISGFPRRAESKYDTFGTAHSSTSISAALGMAVASKIKNENRRCIAVIGDGAMSAGMAYEAMNNAGAMDADLLVILNDNEMSISPPVGALTNYLARLLSGRIYSTARRASEHLLKRVGVWELARRTEEHVKAWSRRRRCSRNSASTTSARSTGTTSTRSSHARQHPQAERPAVPARHHAQGQGYKLAEDDPIAYHGPSNSILRSESPRRRKADLLAGVRRLAVRHGRARAAPRRHHAGDARRLGHGALFRALSRALLRRRHRRAARGHLRRRTRLRGHEAGGRHLFDLQRGYDQLIHDVAIQNLPVLFALDRGGLVGGDGATHNGAFDYAYLRTVPNLTVMAPSDAAECRNMLYTGPTSTGRRRCVIRAAPRRGATAAR